jgi:hypothetical protein
MPLLSDFSIGPYKLNGSINGLSGLVKFSVAAHHAIGRQFAEEIIYNAPPEKFLGRAWNVVLQTIDGQVCKFALYQLVPTSSEANQLVTETRQFFTEQQWGCPSKQKTGTFFWDAPDGNVVLQTGESGQGFCVGVFVTSRVVRKFALSDHLSIGTDYGDVRSNDSFQIFYAASTCTAIVLFALWASGYLGWAIGAQICMLGLLAPFGMLWSRPDGKRVYIPRATISIMGIAVVSAVIANFKLAMIAPLLLYIAASFGLSWLAKTVHGTKSAAFYALLVNCGAAYSVGFALEILLLELRGMIPGHQPWPVFSWAVIGVTAFAIAATARPSRLFAIAPCWTIAGLMIVYGALWGTDATVLPGVGMILIGMFFLILIPSTKGSKFTDAALPLDESFRT